MMDSYNLIHKEKSFRVLCCIIFIYSTKNKSSMSMFQLNANIVQSFLLVNLFICRKCCAPAQFFFFFFFFFK